MTVQIIRFDLPDPRDMSALAAAIEAADPKQIRRLAIFARVAGEYGGGTRELAKAAVDELLARYALADRTEMVTIIGCDGASTPFVFALVDKEGARGTDGAPRLAIGLAHGAPPPEQEFDRASYASAVAAVVKQAIQDAGLETAEVVTVIINVPEAISGNAAIRGRKARAAAALGAGIVIGEIAQAQITDSTLAIDESIHTKRAQSYIGPTIKNIEVIVIGNREGVGGDLMACSTIMSDLLDVKSFKRMLVAAGLSLEATGELAEADRVVATIAKSGVRPDGMVLGAPTTIFSSTVSADRHVRAALSGVLGGVLQSTRVFSTFDPVQQAPPGGGAVCCILRVAPV